MDNFWLSLFVPFIGSLLATLLGWAAVPSFIHDFKNNTLTKDPIPYPIAFLTVFSFVIYGIAFDSIWTSFGNFLPVIGNLISSIICISLCKERKILIKIIILLILSILIILLELLLLISNFVLDNIYIKNQILSYLVIILCILMFASPTIATFHTIKIKNSSNISLPLASTGLICSVFWTIYGLYTNLLGLWIPNAVGIVLTSFTIVIKIIYR